MCPKVAAPIIIITIVRAAANAGLTRKRSTGYFSRQSINFLSGEGYEPFYEEILRKAFRLTANNGNYSRKNVLQEIRELNGKTEQARIFLLSGEFTGANFQTVKRDCENRITVLEARLPNLAFAVKNVDEMVTRCITNSK